jgi:hypothetical protein
MRTIIVAGFLWMSAGAALANPFCVVSHLGTDCGYYDQPSCQRAAQLMDGVCVVNQTEERRSASPPSSDAPYCVVAAYGTQCWYYNVQACQRAAANAQGACVVNTNR